jgi:NAD(P)-dependent dehydrogenase (short-subunit alcohol dehydrogenase family)
VGAPGTTPYTAAKHGILGITRTVALELATAGVGVNAIAPATVQTPLNATLLGNADPFADALVRKGQPIGRNAQPEEIADAVLWLASDRSTFVTGSTLVIDGGFTAQ